MLQAIPDWSRTYGILRNVWDSGPLRKLVYGSKMLDAQPADSFTWLEENFPPDLSGLEAMRKFEVQNKMVNDLLWNEDRVSMRVGLEVRVPFLDWDLMTAAASRSAQQLMPRGQAKFELKALARKSLPESVIERKKSGFQIDVANVSRGILKPLFDEYLSRERLLHHGFFNVQFVEEVLKNAGNKSWRWNFFMLYMMAQTHILVEEFELT